MSIEPKILALLKGVRRNGEGWKAKCPAHDDKTPSLGIAIGDDGRTLINCHAGCTTEAICAALDIKLADLFPNSSAPAERQIVATYPYHDASGELVFEVVRFSPKDFRQRKPDKTVPDGWTWNTRGVQKVLFRLPEVSRDGEHGLPIFICEGEKDVLAMVEKGFSATCNPGGAGKWQDSFSKTLRDTEVTIIADKDAAGRDHAQLVASKLHGVAKSVRIIELPDVNGKPVKDAADFFKAGGDAGQIQEFADSAPEWKESE